jgi:hypothetical protein
MFRRAFSCVISIQWSTPNPRLGNNQFSTRRFPATHYHQSASSSTVSETPTLAYDSARIGDPCKRRKLSRSEEARTMPCVTYNRADGPSSSSHLSKRYQIIVFIMISVGRISCLTVGGLGGHNGVDGAKSADSDDNSRSQTKEQRTSGQVVIRKYDQSATPRAPNAKGLFWGRRRRQSAKSPKKPDAPCDDP